MKDKKIEINPITPTEGKKIALDHHKKCLTDIYNATVKPAVNWSKKTWKKIFK